MAVLAYFTFGIDRHPRQTADMVLARAVDSETASEAVRKGSQPGVVFAKLQLRSGRNSWEWSVYRDQSGQRKPRFRTTSESDIALQSRLGRAGVLREAPLSPTSYRAWENRLGKHSDRVSYTVSGTITVTTTVPEEVAGPVREESLTLRTGDFHPVARTIAFRNQETVEIAEVDRRILPWDQVNSDWFENADSPDSSLNASMGEPRSTAASRFDPLNEADLSLAELQARLVLARRDADVNEQIELTRRPEGILVHGLISSAEQKRELQIALADLPHVVSQLKTTEEQDESDPIPSAPARMKLAESISTPSPLLLFWKSRFRNLDDFPHASGSILNAGLRIRQQSRALRALVEEFEGTVLSPGPAQDAYAALWREHERKLRSALAEEAVTLKTLNPSVPKEMPAADALPISIEELDQSSIRLLRLCRELTGGSDSGQKDAEPILSSLGQETERASITLSKLLVPKD